MGLWPISKSHTERYIKIALSLTYDVLCAFIAWGEINQLIQCVDLTYFAEGVLATGTAITVIVKNLIVVIKRKELEDLIMKMNELYTIEPIQPNAKLKHSMEQASYRCKIIILFCIFLMSLMTVMYSVTPWMKLYNSGIKEFPFPQVYPFDTSKWNIYIPIYVATVLATFRYSICFVGDTLLVGFILLLCTRIDFLLGALEMSIEESRIKKTSTKLFGNCVDYHQKICK